MKFAYQDVLKNRKKNIEVTVIFGLLSAPVYKPHALFFFLNPNFILI